MISAEEMTRNAQHVLNGIVKNILDSGGVDELTPLATQIDSLTCVLTVFGFTPTFTRNLAKEIIDYESSENSEELFHKTGLYINLP